MQAGINNIWERYVQFYYDHYSPHDVNKDSGLPTLRDKLFISVLLITVPIGTLVYIPSILVSISTGAYVVGLFDTLTLIIVLFLFFYRKQSIRLKKILYSSTFYILAIILNIYLGIKGPATIILVCISVMITLFQSKRAGLIAVGLNAIIFMSLLMILPIDQSKIYFFREYTVETWLGVGLNLIAFNAIAVLSVSSLVDKLNNSFLEEKKLQSLLKKESIGLLKAKQKAEESDRLKSAFLANMSHELRTPMNGILGFSALLSEPDIKYEERQKFVDIIEKSSTRLLNIINEIVDISKLESGMMEVNLRETNINEQVKYVYSILKPDSEHKNLKLSCLYNLSDDEAKIITDGEKFYAILSNLVKNAIKYTDHGSIEFGYTLKPSPETEMKSDNAFLEFYVRDTGIGIPHDRQEAIFDRFIQADIADLQARQGVGLGLSIARSYVKLLNGTIWLESEPSKGSSFYFTLPYRKVNR